MCVYGAPTMTLAQSRSKGPHLGFLREPRVCCRGKACRGKVCNCVEVKCVEVKLVEVKLIEVHIIST